MAKGHNQQYAHQRTLVVKQLLTALLFLHHCGMSEHCPMPDMFPVANTSCVPELHNQSVYSCLIWYLAGCALLNASQMASDNDSAK